MHNPAMISTIPPPKAQAFDKIFRRHNGLVVAKATLITLERLVCITPVVGQQLGSAIGIAKSIIGVVEVRVPE